MKYERCIKRSINYLLADFSFVEVYFGLATFDLFLDEIIFLREDKNPGLEEDELPDDEPIFLPGSEPATEDPDRLTGTLLFPWFTVLLSLLYTCLSL